MLSLDHPTLTGFPSLLQYGILLHVEQPAPIMPLLLGLPGVTEAYLRDEVQTIFVDGVAADDLQQHLSAGRTLALSAAMPGLAGAIFRREGMHGSLRSRPAHKASAQAGGGGDIILKLFNSVASDLAEPLLQSGVYMRGEHVHAFGSRRKDLFEQIEKIVLDGSPLGVDALLARLKNIPKIRVQTELVEAPVT